MAAAVTGSTPTAAEDGGPSHAPLFHNDAHTSPSDCSGSEDHDEDNDGASSSSRPTTSSPVTSPPYWTHGQTHRLGDGKPGSSPSAPGAGGRRGGRGGGGGGVRGGHLRPGELDNNYSSESVNPPGAITLQDNETGPGDDGDEDDNRPERVSGRDRNRACWAKGVSVTDYVIVNGSATNIGAFVVWNIRVETLSGSYMNIRKRYSEFDDLRHKLIMTFPNFEAAVPALPPKSVISKFRPRFLEKRRSGLQYFLNCILLNPEFSGSPVLKEFLFS